MAPRQQGRAQHTSVKEAAAGTAWLLEGISQPLPCTCQRNACAAVVQARADALVAADLPLPGDSAATDEQLIAEFEQSVGVGGQEPRVPLLQHEPPCQEEPGDQPQSHERVGADTWAAASSTAGSSEGYRTSPGPARQEQHGQVPQGYGSGQDSWQPPGRAVPGSSLGKRRTTADVKPSEHVALDMH